jgi:hypothetical protein
MKGCARDGRAANAAIARDALEKLAPDHAGGAQNQDVHLSVLAVSNDPLWA